MKPKRRVGLSVKNLQPTAMGACRGRFLVWAQCVGGRGPFGCWGIAATRQTPISLAALALRCRNAGTCVPRPRPPQSRRLEGGTQACPHPACRFDPQRTFSRPDSGLFIMPPWPLRPLTRPQPTFWLQWLDVCASYPQWRRNLRGIRRHCVPRLSCLQPPPPP